MTNYDVRVSSPNFNVNLQGEDAYNVDVNYEAPLRSVQYTNLIIDDFSSLFDGTRTIFDLVVNGSPYTPSNEQQIIVSVNGLQLRPGIDYQVSGSTIEFASAPSNGSEFSGVALQTTADLTRTVVFLIDNGSNDITPGDKGLLTMDITGDIVEWRVLSEQTGNIAINIEKATYADFPDNFTSIVGSEFPVLLNQNKNKDDNLTTWSKNLDVGDVLRFSALSCTGIQRCSVFLKIKI